MKNIRRQRSFRPAASGELAKLRTRLADVEKTLLAIGRGEVDTVSVAGNGGRQVFTLNGAEHAYRELIESMNEGALTLTADMTILYANQCFARMVRRPLEQVIGGAFPRFLSGGDRVRLRILLKKIGPAGSKLAVLLQGPDGSHVPVQISIRPVTKTAAGGAMIGMVVTDMTEARRSEESLRELTHRVVQAQETERGRVALELHDNITQQLCAVTLYVQSLLDKLPVRSGSRKVEATKVHEMLASLGEEVERISRNLRPSILDQLGLEAVLRETTAEFTKRTGVKIKLDYIHLDKRLPADSELALYRILQEALKNVEKHAKAREVSVTLSQPGRFIQLAIRDDGIGFNPNRRIGAGKKMGDLGLFSMRERATYVRGALTIVSSPRSGTSIEVLIPLP
ncbi:MAG: histidine kinase [Verrucomicrobia bacterium]|nr:histidine kinase [Verrucomicrobiota bacterium]